MRSGQGSARAALRSATQAAHDRANALPPFAAIAAGRLQRPAYAQLLRALFRFHLGIAAAARRTGWAGVSTSEARLELIAADLDHLGVALPPGPGPLVDGGPGDGILGAIYVAEGSLLGGRVLAGQLDYLLGPGADGRRFFLGRGKVDSLHWQRLLAILERRLAAPAARQSAIAAAIRAFELVEALVLEPASALPYSAGLTKNCSMRPLAGS